MLVASLVAAAEQIVPFSDPKGEHVLLELPPDLAAAVGRVRLELNGVLLPASRTKQQLSLRPVPGAEQYQEVAGLYTLRQLIHGATLLPCTALFLEAPEGGQGHQGTGQEQQQVELVLRVHWPLASLGQQVHDEQLSWPA
jgi:hypothetical protein